jgi:hypothetical protein
MRYDVPVFAYAVTAVPETLRYSGVLFPISYDSVAIMS